MRLWPAVRDPAPEYLPEIDVLKSLTSELAAKRIAHADAQKENERLSEYYAELAREHREAGAAIADAIATLGVSKSVNALEFTADDLTI